MTIKDKLIIVMELLEKYLGTDTNTDPAFGVILIVGCFIGGILMKIFSFSIIVWVLTCLITIYLILRDIK